MAIDPSEETVIDIVENGGDPVGEALRAASFVALPEQDPQAKHAFDAARDEVRRFLSSLDWISPEYEGHLPVDALATALVQVRDYLFPGYPVEALAPYARVAWLLSEVEFAKSPGGARVPMPGDDITDPTRRAVLGSILFERIFASLRRAANTMRSIRTTAGLPLPPARVLPADRSPAKR